MNQVRRSILVTVLAVVLGAGLAWAGSDHGASLGAVPVFALAVAAAFVVQWAVYIPSQIGRTERYFDLTGSATYATITVVLLVLAEDLSARTLLLGLAVLAWSVRLGTFLFLRIRRDGSDSRFDEIKASPARFLSVWTIQAVWVSLTASAAWIAMTSDQQGSVDALVVVGMLVWLIGFVIEVVADTQKSRFRSRPENRGRFIDVGLWSWSQHPNYFGEITLWVGVALASVGAFSGWQYVGLISPVFVILLLTRVSGIPLLRHKAEQRWGDDPAYRQYVRRTSVLVPRPPRRG